MNDLELKVPPVIVVVATAFLMWLVSRALPAGVIILPGRLVVATALATVGAAISTLGVLAFRRASTTVNPTKPQLTSSLVHSGVYRLTRNPMYLGFLLMLGGWTIFLANALVVLILPLFVLYMNRFQIRPEERALTTIFGEGFRAYTAQVRRWI